jgi:hypothetical protein
MLLKASVLKLRMRMLLTSSAYLHRRLFSQGASINVMSSDVGKSNEIYSSVNRENLFIREHEVTQRKRGNKSFSYVFMSSTCIQSIQINIILSWAYQAYKY